MNDDDDEGEDDDYDDDKDDDEGPDFLTCGMKTVSADPMT